jgi:hypothetical protein
VADLLTEQFDSGCLSEATVEETVVKNVCLCGAKSKNGRTYPPKAFGDGSVYEGRPVFVDHKYNGPQDRSVRDFAGHIKSVVMKGGKPYGDIHTNGTEAGKVMLEVSKNNPRDVGMSHTASCTQSGRGNQRVVESVNEVISVDLVAFPATTKSLSEQTNPSESDMSEVTVDLLKEQLSDQRKQSDEKVAALELTLKESQDKLVASEAKVTELTADLKESDKKNEEHTVREAIQERRKSVFSALKAAELDTEDKAVVSDTFVKSLMSESDESNRSKIIEDRKALIEGVTSEGGGGYGTQNRTGSGGSGSGSDKKKWDMSSEMDSMFGATA